MTTKKTEPNPAKPEYEPTSQERTAIDKHRARKAASPAPRLSILKDEEKSVRFSLHHPDAAIGYELLMEAFGTADKDFLEGLVEQLFRADPHGRQIDERGLNFMVSLVKGIKPRDQVEAMLAAQMAAVHMATMTFAERLTQVGNIPQQDSAERAFNKLARTFASQMEALKRYRTGGEQKVTVQHVSVSDGGQAIGKNVTQAPAKTVPEKTAASPPALMDSRTSAVTVTPKPAPAVVPFKRKASK
jgi:hypothetical protein